MTFIPSPYNGASYTVKMASVYCNLHPGAPFTNMDQL